MKLKVLVLMFAVMFMSCISHSGPFKAGLTIEERANCTNALEVQDKVRTIIQVLSIMRLTEDPDSVSNRFLLREIGTYRQFERQLEKVIMKKCKLT
jgi:hypothetical protein